MNGVVAIYIFGGFLFLFIIIHYYRQYTSNTTKEQDKLTRIQTECPDFWVVEESNKCRNTHKLGKCLTRDNGGKDNGGLMDFNTDYFQNKDSGNYAKCRWAKTCNVSWDGIDHICI